MAHPTCLAFALIQILIDARRCALLAAVTLIACGSGDEPGGPGSHDSGAAATSVGVGGSTGVATTSSGAGGEGGDTSTSSTTTGAGAGGMGGAEPVHGRAMIVSMMWSLRSIASSEKPAK